MIKYNKPVLFFLLFSLVTLLTNGQQKVSINEDIAGKFKKYCDAVPREEIYIHTDREDYIAGEEVWFNSYLIDRKTTEPYDNSRIIYFELINPENRPVVQKRIKIENGSGQGMVVIPDTSTTGEYTLRAYTSWMKNSLPENCYTKEIKVYNALNSKRFKEKINKTPIELELQNSRAIIHPGFEADVNNLEPGILKINIKTNESFRNENGNLIYLFIQTHGLIDLNKPETLTGDITRISLPKESLTPGINHITLFNSREEPLFERLIYTPSMPDNLLTLNSPESIGKRNKILLEIKLDKKLVQSSDKFNFSISVAPQTIIHNTMDITDYMIFGSEFGILPDEIKNKKLSELPPEVPDRFLQTAKSNWIDWSVILSDKLPELKYKNEKENHFISGILFNKNDNKPDSAQYIFLSVPGKVAGFQYSKTDKDGNFSFSIPISQTIKNIIIQPEEVDRNNIVKIMSSFSEEYLSRGDQSGTIDQETPRYISKNGINYQVRKIYEISSVGSQIETGNIEPELKRFYGKPDIELIMDNYIKLPLMDEVFFELLPGVFLKSRKSRYEITVSDPVENKIYQKPPVLLIDGVRVTDATIIANLDPETVEKIEVMKEKYFIGDYLFYGIVNVITRAGDFSYVKLPDYAVRLAYRVIDPVNSFISPDYSTKEKKQSHTPDFRNTLYWNPSAIPGDDGKIMIEFWASDFADDYLINVQGITQTGGTISYMKRIKIE